MAPERERLRRRMIADAAYFRAQRRGFHDGDPVADWLEAEAEVDAVFGGPSECQRLDERLATVDEEIRWLKKSLAEMTTGARKSCEADIERLAKLRDRFQKRAGKIREQGGRASEEARRQVEAIWSEISSVVDHASSLGRSWRF